MPYIICANQPGCLPESDPRAVATLEEARQEVFGVAEDHLGVGDLTAVDACRAIGEQGGVFDLGNGYVIDCQHHGWIDFEVLVRGQLEDAPDLPDVAIFDQHSYREELIAQYNDQ